MLHNSKNESKAMNTQPKKRSPYLFNQIPTRQPLPSFLFPYQALTRMIRLKKIEHAEQKEHQFQQSETEHFIQVLAKKMEAKLSAQNPSQDDLLLTECWVIFSSSRFLNWSEMRKKGRESPFKSCYFVLDNPTLPEIVRHQRLKVFYFDQSKKKLERMTFDHLETQEKKHIKNFFITLPKYTSERFLTVDELADIAFYTGRQSTHAHQLLSLFSTQMILEVTDIENYMQRLQEVTHRDFYRSQWLFSWIYLEKFLKATHLTVTTANIQRLILVSLCLAEAMLIDNYYTNDAWAQINTLAFTSPSPHKVSSGDLITEKQLNRLKILFFHIVNFNLTVTKAEEVAYEKECTEAFDSPIAHNPVAFFNLKPDSPLKANSTPVTSPVNSLKSMIYSLFSVRTQQPTSSPGQTHSAVQQRNCPQ